MEMNRPYAEYRMTCLYYS